VRLLFAANTPADPNLGAPGCDLATIAALRELGHEVDEIWEPAHPRRIRHANLHQLLELPRAYERAVAARWRERTYYDVVQVSQPHAYLAALRHKRQRRRGVFVNRSHGWEPHVREVFARYAGRDERPRWRRWSSQLLWLLLRRHNELVARAADGIVVCSREDRDDVVRRHAADPARVLALAPGIDPLFLAAPFTPVSADRARRMLYVGQFTPVKAPEMVAQVAGLVMRGDPTISLTWVCADVHHAAARVLVEPAVRARVRLLDWMPRADLRAVYDDHGLLLFPSHYEAFPLAFLEGMARGLGVVGTAVGGLREVLRDGVNGFLAEPRDAGALAQAARRFVADADLRARVSSAARQTAEGFSWRRAAQELTEFYGRLAPRVDGA
jgi:glycosyltransferase involved in cell wall biosynthesis